MKRLGVYACIAILTISFFGDFITPKTVKAQGTPTVTTLSRPQLMSQGTAIFTTYISELQQQAANPTQVPALANQSATVVNNYVSGLNNNLIPAVVIARDLFINTFNSPAGASTNYYADYSAALLRAIASINTAQQNTPQIRTNPLLRTEVTDISNRLRTESSSMQNQLIASGNTAAAQTLQNAVGAQTTQQLQNDLDSAEGCFDLTGFSLSGCLSKALAWLIKVTLVEVAGFLLALAAGMFNYSVQVGILNFSQWAPDTLYPIWLIIRQILSLMVVFVGLYLGFMYILGKDEKFAKYVPWVIIFALFVNFSYPIARTAIDVSNIVSLNIYASAVGNNAITGTGGAGAGTIIVNRLGLQGLMGRSATAGGSSALLEVNSISGALLVVAFALYAAYIFFMVTGIIVMRTAALVFLTVASPFLLIDSVLPFLGEKAMQIRKIFFEQLIVGPVFMIMLALTMSFLDVFNGPLQAGGSSTATFFNLVMMLIMLHIMITVTKKTAGAIGEYATGAMGKIGGVGLGVAAGGAGLLARKGIGGLAMKARESSWVQNNKDSMIGRSAYSMSNSLANSSFDLRNSKVVAGKMSKLGMGMGMGRTMGYEEHARKRSEEVQKVGETAGARHKEDVLDAAGNVIHKKGDFTEEGRLAYSRYNETLGGRSIFMSKEQKEKTKELLKENVTKNMEKEEALIKKRAEELSKSYNNIKTITKEDGTEISVKEQQAEILGTMKKDLLTLKASDKNLKSSEAQSLSAAINAITDKNKDEAVAFNKKIAEQVAKHNNIAGEDPASVARRNRIVDSLDSGEQKAFNERLSNPGKPAPIAQTTQTKIDVDLDTPMPTPTQPTNTNNAASVVNVQTESFQEKMAAKRKAALAQNAATAEAEMNRNSKPSPSGGEPSTPTTPPVPPKTPSTSSAAANQTPFDPSNAGANKEPLAA